MTLVERLRTHAQSLDAEEPWKPLRNDLNDAANAIASANETSRTPTLAEERLAWDRYVAGVSADPQLSTVEVLAVADRLLEERRKRFGADK